MSRKTRIAVMFVLALTALVGVSVMLPHDAPPQEKAVMLPPEQPPQQQKAVTLPPEPKAPADNPDPPQPQPKVHRPEVPPAPEVEVESLIGTWKFTRHTVDAWHFNDATGTHSGRNEQDWEGEIKILRDWSSPQSRAFKGTYVLHETRFSHNGREKKLTQPLVEAGSFEGMVWGKEVRLTLFERTTEKQITLTKREKGAGWKAYHTEGNGKHDPDNYFDETFYLSK